MKSAKRTFLWQVSFALQLSKIHKEKSHMFIISKQKRQARYYGYEETFSSAFKD